MRTRYKTYLSAPFAPQSVTEQWTWIGSSAPYTSIPPTVDPLKHSGAIVESMTDSIEKSKFCKEVTHTLNKWELEPLLMGVDIVPPWGRFQTWSPVSRFWQNAQGGGTHDPSWLGGLSVTPTYPRTDEQLRSAALHKFYSENQVNNLLTAIETPQLISSLQSIRSFLTDSRLKKASSLAASIKKLSLRAASLHLGWSFGFAPLVSDLQKMCREFPKMREKLKRVKGVLGKPYIVTVHCEGTPTLNVPVHSGYYGNNRPPQNYVNGGTYWHYGAHMCIQAPKVSYHVRGIDEGLSNSSSPFVEADFWMKRLLSVGPASLAWELVPFSFVLDWFVDTSGIFDRLDNLLTGCRKQVLEVWRTEAYESRLEIFRSPEKDHIRTIEHQRLGSGTVRFYHREPKPIGQMPTLSGRFGKKQVALSASLLLQMGRNVRV